MDGAADAGQIVGTGRGATAAGGERERGEDAGKRGCGNELHGVSVFRGDRVPVLAIGQVNRDADAGVAPLEGAANDLISILCPTTITNARNADTGSRSSKA